MGGGGGILPARSPVSSWFLLPFPRPAPLPGDPPSTGARVRRWRCLRGSRRPHEREKIRSSGGPSARAGRRRWYPRCPFDLSGAIIAERALVTSVARCRCRFCSRSVSVCARVLLAHTTVSTSKPPNAPPLVVIALESALPCALPPPLPNASRERAPPLSGGSTV